MKKKSDSEFLVGFARADITPSESLPMGGYAARSEPAIGAHDPLFARAIAFRHRDTYALLLILDLLCVSRQWALALRREIRRKTGVPIRNILVAATHTHSGPAVFAPAATRAEDLDRYEKTLSTLCLDAAERAFAAAEPSLMRVCRSGVDGVAGNRRDPAKPLLSSLSVVRVENLSGAVKGHLVSYACHPTVMSADNLQYSADLFGVAAREVERKFADSACALFNGGAGDVSARYTRRTQTWGELDRLGKKLGREIIRASRNGEPVTSGQISAKSGIMHVRFRRILSPKQAEHELAVAQEKALDAMLRLDEEGKDPMLAASLLEGPAVQYLLSRVGGWKFLFGTDAADFEVQVIRIGDIIVSALPGEFFSERENLLKNAAAPRIGLFIGFANGYWGYAVPPKEAKLGGYELMMSPLEAGTEPQIIKEAKALIRDIKKPARRKTQTKHA